MNQLRLLAWESTKRCNLSCAHCRASSIADIDPEELSTLQVFKLIDEVSEISKPIFILSGGEPLLREDLFEIASYGNKKGLRVTMATNGTLITPEIASRIKRSGIQRVSVSLDGATSESHDSFRKVEGAFKASLEGIKILKKEGIAFQINTTITKINKYELPAIHKLTLELGAVAHHIFLLVPTGRGKEMASQSLSPEEYEEILLWFYNQSKQTSIQLKATCAPQYYRILRQEAKKEGKAVTFETHGLDAITRGCLAGTAFCFISSKGNLQPCGYLEVICGNIKETSFKTIWNSSEVLLKLRDFSNYEGRCGKCEYIRVCGGCRARAYEKTGNFLSEEPLCSYIPKKQ